jgi:AraC-like DNA-binding protein
MTRTDRNMTPPATPTGAAIREPSTVTSLAFAPLLRRAASVSQALERAVREASGPLPETLSLEIQCPVSSYLAAWEALALGYGTSAVSVQVASSSSLAELEIFGFLAMTARSLNEAFARVARVHALWASGAGWSMVPDPASAGVHMRYHPWPAPEGSRGSRLATEFTVAEMLQSVREMVGIRVVPLSVSFNHSPPEDLRPFTDFFGVTPDFTPSANGRGAVLTLSTRLGTLPIKAFDTRLHAFFLRECDAMIARLGAREDEWLQRVRRVIADAHAHGQRTALELARTLGMSPRSLRRRFAEEETSFRAVKDGVCVALANAYLQRDGLTASEVAFLLGFAEPSAFFRAYRRWTGETPRDYQTRQRSR